MKKMTFRIQKRALYNAVLWIIWMALTATTFSAAAASPPPLPPPPPPPPPPQSVPPQALQVACEALGPCELYAQLQEHSRRIAGFSYNVKKADAALTTLARQQQTAAERAQRLALALTQLEAGLEGASNGGNGSENGGSGGGILLLAAPAPATAAPDWEKAAARELARLGDRLSRLREQVNTSFIVTLRENGDELQQLRGRVATLHVQVADLEAAVRGETTGRRVSAEGGSTGPSQIPMGTTATPTAPTQHVSSEDSSEEVRASTPQTDEGADSSEEKQSNATIVDHSTSSSVGTLSPTSPALEDISSTAQSEVQIDVATPPNVDESENGNGETNGNGESVDVLGIELETVRTAFDTLHAQVTELQARCDSRGDELEAMVAALEQRLANLEANGSSSDRMQSSSVSTQPTPTSNLEELEKQTLFSTTIPTPVITDTSHNTTINSTSIVPISAVQESQAVSMTTESNREIISVDAHDKNESNPVVTNSTVAPKTESPVL